MLIIVFISKFPNRYHLKIIMIKQVGLPVVSLSNID